MLLKDLGEDAIIRLISKAFECNDPRVIKAIGDDTSVTLLDADKDDCLLATTDTLVEGVHFDTAYTPYRLIGRKSVSVSLSDIAAMGGTPLFLLTSITLPPGLEQREFELIYEGIREVTADEGVCLIGGNTTTSPGPITITTTLLGSASSREVVYRSGASEGDDVYISGTVGDAAIGLEVLKEKGRAALEGKYGSAIMRHLDPAPRSRAGRTLAKRGLVTAMTDVSDGLIRDASHIAEASGKGVQINAPRVPLSDDFKEYSKEAGLGKEALSKAFGGGEDYELLFCAPETCAEKIEAASKELGIDFTRIGKVTLPGDGVKIVDDDEREIPRLSSGYEHFKDNP